jgi:tetratricopeptide (TPR) repeat protein
MSQHLKIKLSLCLGILSLLLLYSCAGFHRENIRDHVREIDRQARLDIESGRFQEAIDLYREAHQKYPKNSGVRGEYIQTLELMKGMGDRALENKEFASAENIYDVLLRNWSYFADFSQSLSFDPDLLDKMRHAGRKGLVDKQVRSSFAAGEYSQGIAIRREFAQAYPRDPAARNDYVRALELAYGSGNHAFQQKEFASAGKIYTTVLKGLPFARDLGLRPSVDASLLNTRIDTCRKILFERGLQRYRSGDFSVAISTWKSILVFAPNNQEIRKAVETATVQAQKLKRAH